MFRIPRSRSGSPAWPPMIDLSTVRETLSYIQDDMERVPELAKVAAALRATVAEIDQVKPRPTVQNSPFAARFLPWRGA